MMNLPPLTEFYRHGQHARLLKAHLDDMQASYEKDCRGRTPSEQEAIRNAHRQMKIRILSS
jgi:hypothetical protein